MAAPDYKARFSEARTLLDYGYGICKLYQDENMDILPDAIVLGGVKESVSLQYESGFTFLSTDGSDVSNITKQIQINDQIQAPVTEGEVAGKAIYYLEGEEIGSVNLLFKESIKKAGFFDYFKKIMEGYLL